MRAFDQDNATHNMLWPENWPFCPNFAKLRGYLWLNSGRFTLSPAEPLYMVSHTNAVIAFKPLCAG